nr:hypothetical protein Q903MT_gene1065 [Picea sitchensis]
MGTALPLALPTHPPARTRPASPIDTSFINCLGRRDCYRTFIKSTGWITLPSLDYYSTYLPLIIPLNTLAFEPSIYVIYDTLFMESHLLSDAGC